MKVLNTIKFRLVAWFSALLILSTILTLALINSVIRSNRVPPPQNQIQQPGVAIDVSTITERVQEDRTNFGNQVFAVSVIAVGVQILLASGGSYLIINRMLKPLAEINKLMKEINELSLYAQIDVKGNAEEINELILNFNSMISRLDKAFAGQKQFVENVSHEIKTPLTVIKTNLESILYDDSVTKDEMTDAMQAAIKSINYLNVLTEDLLLLSIVDKQNVKLEKVAVLECVKEVEQELDSFAKSQKIELTLTTKDEEGYILAQKVLLKRAVANIVENALKYSPRKSKVEIMYSLNSTGARIEVIDQGKGIPKEYQTKIFDRFYRIDKSRSRNTGGTGLGLAITQEIVRLFKGKIELESDTTGSKFVISFPHFI
jgi:signal transduction histidine kinase